MSNAAQPSASVPIVDTKTGMLTPAWAQWFMQSSNAGAGPFQALPTTGEQVASATGFFCVTGGSVASVTLTRGRDTIVLVGFDGFIPVANKDRITIQGNAGEVWFIPVGPA